MYKLKQIVILTVELRTMIKIIMLIETNVTISDNMLICLKDMEVMLRITQSHCFNVYAQNFFD